MSRVPFVDDLDAIHVQRNKFVTGVKIKATVD